MLVVVDGKEVTEVCEMQLNAMKLRKNVELVIRIDGNQIITKDRVYERKQMRVKKGL